LIITNICDSIKEGLGERKETKDKIAQEKAARDAKKEAEKISKEDNQEKEEVKS
jgi:hypothetical protein